MELIKIDLKLMLGSTDLVPNDEAVTIIILQKLRTIVKILHYAAV